MSSKAAVNPDLGPVFIELRAILAKHTKGLAIVHDRPDHYYVDTHTIGANKHPINFGSVRIGKRYVSYHLMPVCSPGVTDGMSAALKKRMQGKACFNFSEIDGPLFEELDRLTGAGFKAWQKIEWVG